MAYRLIGRNFQNKSSSYSKVFPVPTYHHTYQQTIRNYSSFFTSTTTSRNPYRHHQILSYSSNQLHHLHPSFSQSLRTRTFVTAPVLHSEMVDVTFVRSDGSKLKTKGKIGDNLLDVIVNNSLDLDGFGACEGTLACSTCHLIFKKEDFDKINDKITDEELDMLDLAYGLTETSRLGCQVTLTKELDGLEVQVPDGVIDQRS